MNSDNLNESNTIFDREKLELDIKDIRKITIGAVAGFKECKVPMNATSLRGYAVMKVIEDGMDEFSKYVEDKRSSEKMRPTDFKMATEEEAKPKKSNRGKGNKKIFGVK